MCRSPSTAREHCGRLLMRPPACSSSSGQQAALLAYKPPSGALRPHRGQSRAAGPHNNSLTPQRGHDGPGGHNKHLFRLLKGKYCCVGTCFYVAAHSLHNTWIKKRLTITSYSPFVSYFLFNAPWPLFSILRLPLLSFLLFFALFSTLLSPCVLHNCFNLFIIRSIFYVLVSVLSCFLLFARI